MNPLAYLFLIIGLGYLIGSIDIFGIKFGNSAIILVGIVFGHFGAQIPDMVGTLGLVMFIGAVGLKAGKNILYFLKTNGLSFLLIALFVISLSGILSLLFYYMTGIDKDLVMGILSGAMTSTTALAAAQEAGAGQLAVIGYGITYIFGVVGIVSLVQVMPKLMGVNQEEEIDKLRPPKNSTGAPSLAGFKQIDKNGLFVFFTTVLLGMVLGSLEVPLPGGSQFSLGNSGGPLIVGLLAGHFKRIGQINIEIPNDILNVFSSLGISLFLSDSGINAGQGIVDILGDYGLQIFIMGMIMTLVTSLLGFALAYLVFKLPVYGALGTTTGAMTSAPSLGALMESSQTDLVVPFYAACQPIATILLVFLPQVLNLIIAAVG